MGVGGGCEEGGGRLREATVWVGVEGCARSRVGSGCKKCNGRDLEWCSRLICVDGCDAHTSKGLTAPGVMLEAEKASGGTCHISPCISQASCGAFESHLSLGCLCWVTQLHGAMFWVSVCRSPEQLGLCAQHLVCCLHELSCLADVALAEGVAHSQLEGSHVCVHRKLVRVKSQTWQLTHHGEQLRTECMFGQCHCLQEEPERDLSSAHRTSQRSGTRRHLVMALCVRDTCTDQQSGPGEALCCRPPGSSWCAQSPPAVPR